MKQRLLTVALAALLALAGTGTVLVYVRHADQRALAGQKAVSVLVATKEIPAGTSARAALAGGLLASQRMPSSSVPSDALGSIPPSLSALVTGAAVQPGELLLRPLLVPQVQTIGGLAIPPGMEAVTIQLCVPEAIAGNLRVGSQVEVFDTRVNGGNQATAQPACTGPHTQQGTSASTSVVLSKVTVISIGPGPAAGGTTGGTTGSFGSASSSGSGSQSTLLVTFAVSQADAQQVIQLTEAGLPYLALLTGPSPTGLDTQPAPAGQP